MRYEGNIYRPPSEARSLILQVTIGCAHNKCTFCSMFIDKEFRVRNEEEVFEDLDSARKKYRAVDKVFLADGDALCLTTDKLLRILAYIKKTFPECRRVGVYGTPQDTLNKSEEDLIKLREAGLGIVYIGAESGSEQVIKNIKKGVTRQQIIDAVKKLEASGLAASVTFISGLGGKELWQEHAVETGKMISEMGASYVGLLTLMVERGTELTADIEAGKFQLLSGAEIVEETALMMENINVTEECVFRSNHASNYVSLSGTLPQDKNEMMEDLEHVLKNLGRLKDERFRLL